MRVIELAEIKRYCFRCTSYIGLNVKDLTHVDQDSNNSIPEHSYWTCPVCNEKNIINVKRSK